MSKKQSKFGLSMISSELLSPLHMDRKGQNFCRKMELTIYSNLQKEFKSTIQKFKIKTTWLQKAFGLSKIYAFSQSDNMFKMTNCSKYPCLTLAVSLNTVAVKDYIRTIFRLIPTAFDAKRNSCFYCSTLQSFMAISKK